MKRSLKIKNTLSMSLKTTVFIILLWAFGSCSSLPAPFFKPQGEAWAVPSSAREIAHARGVTVGTVSVDHRLDSGSIEKELSRLVPLVLVERGFVPLGGDQSAALVVDVSAVEREYSVGWQTERSIVLEVQLRFSDAPTLYGRSLAGGRHTLANSSDLTALLRAAVQSAFSASGKGKAK
jgi:hypothetical protein